MDWLIELFKAVPNGFWMFLNTAAVPFFLWLFNRVKRGKENKLSDKIDLIDSKINILNESHKHRPFYIDLRVKLEEKVFYTTKDIKNKYVAELLGRSLEKLMPIVSDILESDFKIVGKEKTENRILLAAKTIRDTIVVSKLKLKKGTEILFMLELAEELKGIISSYSFDLELITITKENGKRREAFDKLTTTMVDRIVNASLLVYSKYKMELKND